MLTPHHDVFDFYGHQTFSHIRDISSLKNICIYELRNYYSEPEDAFFELYPSHTIYFKGTSKSRTRLYQMAINHYYDEISVRFNILGELDDKMTRFIRNTNYKSFLILKK